MTGPGFISDLCRWILPGLGDRPEDTEGPAAAAAAAEDNVADGGGVNSVDI